MCTITLIARRNGYALGMNRDESRARITGLPPQLRIPNDGSVLCPSEPGGGTWIALNEAGTTLALVNWYSISERVKANTLSRGAVVNAVSAAGSPVAVATALTQLPLSRVNPFRLIGVFPAGELVVEWDWDLKQLVRKPHSWQTQQWISSGFDEPGAQRIRSETFRHARRQHSAGSLDWLRRLHRSHTPKRGPFSTCMHRDDAVTVSYTEITVNQTEGRMRYYAGPPCQCTTCSLHHLTRIR